MEFGPSGFQAAGRSDAGQGVAFTNLGHDNRVGGTYRLVKAVCLAYAAADGMLLLALAAGLVIHPGAALSAAAMVEQVFTKLSGLSEIESISSRTRNSTKSG